MPSDPDRSPLYTTLLIVRDVIEQPASSAELRERYGASDRQLKRYIAEARHLGAKLESVRSEGRYVWRCTNGDDLRMLHTWIALEERQSLLDPDAPPIIA